MRVLYFKNIRGALHRDKRSYVHECIRSGSARVRVSRILKCRQCNNFIAYGKAHRWGSHQCCLLHPHFPRSRFPSRRRSIDDRRWRKDVLAKQGIPFRSQSPKDASFFRYSLPRLTQCPGARSRSFKPASQRPLQARISQRTLTKFLSKCTSTFFFRRYR